MLPGRSLTKAKVVVAIILKQDKSSSFPFCTLRFKMSPSPLTYQSLLDQQLFRRTVIIGAGIVGSAIASYLSIRTSEQIVVLDQCLSPLNGSTGHAPGFVGQLNESLVLTALAKESVQAYRGMPGGFSDCGGLEVARTEQGMEILRTRFWLAETRGLPAKLLNADETICLAPDFVRPDQVLGGLHFLGDGTADALPLTATFRSDAESRGVLFFEGEIRSITRSVSGAISSVGTSLGAPLLCTSLVLATGMWTADLIHKLDLELPTPIPIVPVAHPYVYSRRHAPRLQTHPFIRWPESQIYARDHGTFDGIGSYNHAPIAISKPASTALAPNWPETFAAAIAKAIAQLHDPGLFTEPKSEPRPTLSILPAVRSVKSSQASVEHDL